MSITVGAAFIESKLRQTSISEGDLPPGIGIVGFAIKSFDQVAATFGQNANLAGAPFGNQRAIIVRGPGEALFELVEQPY